MDVSYTDVIGDLAYYRSLGAAQEVLKRTEGVFNHCFILMSKYAELEQALECAQAAVLRYKELLYGSSEAEGLGDDPEREDNAASTEEGDQVLAASNSSDQAGDKQSAIEKPPPETPATRETSKKPRQGHGRLSAAAYTGAEVVHCEHGEHKVGDPCPECLRGKLYAVDPNKKVHITGQAPLLATRYELEALRCALCGTTFTAQPPMDLSGKYTPESKAVLAYLHFGMGLPYHRIARMQTMQGMPIPVGTQSDLMESMMGPVHAVFNHLWTLAAQADLIFQDDTSARVVELIRENRLSAPTRKGMYTTGLVARAKHEIILFVTGRNHAGENFDRLMAERVVEAPPLRMADALSANSKHVAQVLDAKCNAHAFRRFRTLKSMYPEQVSKVLSIYNQIYEHDRHCQKHDYNEQQRLLYHQAHSRPLMEDMKQWAERCLSNHEVEPNSALGRELKYLIKHWQGLIQFLEIAGAPLDNNCVERMLKEIIRYRKNSQIFVSSYSADYGSRCISVITTCVVNKVNAIEYLSVIQKYEAQVWRHPELWMPWNYQETLALHQQAA